jgi:hypothetical protein
MSHGRCLHQGRFVGGLLIALAPVVNDADRQPDNADAERSPQQHQPRFKRCLNLHYANLRHTRAELDHLAAALCHLKKVGPRL